MDEPKEIDQEELAREFERSTWDERGMMVAVAAGMVLLVVALVVGYIVKGAMS